jgi:hypothetical protein
MFFGLSQIYFSSTRNTASIEHVMDVSIRFWKIEDRLLFRSTDMYIMTDLLSHSFKSTARRSERSLSKVSKLDFHDWSLEKGLKNHVKGEPWVVIGSLDCDHACAAFCM